MAGKNKSKVDSVRSLSEFFAEGNLEENDREKID